MALSVLKHWRRHQNGNHGLMITDLAEVIEAAGRGQIADLILSPAAPGFAQREEVINWAALATIRNSGKISFLSAPRPAEGVAGILRYREGRAKRQPDVTACSING